MPAWLDPADNIQQRPFMVQMARLLGGYGFSAPYDHVKLKRR